MINHTFREGWTDAESGGTVELLQQGVPHKEARRIVDENN